MNGDVWTVRYVPAYYPELIDRTNQRRVATTDPRTKTVYLSNELSGSFLKRVLIHELGHCALFSFGLLDDIHRVVDREHWVDAEEWICNLLADYGERIYQISRSILSVSEGYENLLRG